jgi:hypothetical protein
MRLLQAALGKLRALGAIAARMRGLMGLAAAGAATVAPAAVLPEDKAEAMFHIYDGGGVKADGPAFLVRKKLGERVSLSGGYYVDAVSNASIDVVTYASPFKERRNVWDFGADWLVGSSILSLSGSRSTESDYESSAANVDVSAEVFGGMTTLSLGFTRGSDRVGRTDRPEIFFDDVRRWQYRSGVTQILTARWLVSLNGEVISEEGYLGSPYRAARVFGAFVPERLPRTRTGRAVKLRSLAEVRPGTSLRVEARAYWDTWDVRATTWELAGSHKFGGEFLGGNWLLDVSLRGHKQSRALFYSDNAQVDNLFVTRNRQLSAFDTSALGAKLTWTPAAAWAQRWGVQVTGVVERKRFRFPEFTDLRVQLPYAYDANVVQLLVTSRF